jgi:hypothetical protein
MSKQVNKAEATTNEAPSATAAPAATQQQPRNLYMSVKTFNPEGKSIGFRIVDLFHYGTRNWLQDHLWWAMHNANCVEVNIATDDEIGEYLEASAKALQAKFAKEPAQAAA